MSFSFIVYMICESFSFSLCVSGRSAKPDEEKIKVRLGMSAQSRRRDDGAKHNETESCENLAVADSVGSGSLWSDRRSWEGGRRLHMATLATCSSSLAIRRSWRMTRSLSDLNSRSTSSSLSSIFWWKMERVISTKLFLTLMWLFRGELEVTSLSDLLYFSAEGAETLQALLQSAPLNYDLNTKICADP